MRPDDRRSQHLAPARAVPHHGNHCRLADLGGRNGTFVNGEPITEAELHDGDTVVLGRVALRVERTAVAAVALSDHHSLIETRGSVYRRVDEPTGADAAHGVAPARLLALRTEISKHLARWRPLPEVLERVAAVALDSVPAERAFLLLIDVRTGDVEPRVSQTRGGTDDGAGWKR